MRLYCMCLYSLKNDGGSHTSQYSFGFSRKVACIEYWMIYREQGFLAVVWFCSSTPLPLFRQQVVSLSRPSLLTGERGKKRGRSKIIRQQESLVLNNHSILSGGMSGQIWTCIVRYRIQSYVYQDRNNGIKCVLYNMYQWNEQSRPTGMVLVLSTKTCAERMKMFV